MNLFLLFFLYLTTALLPPSHGANILGLFPHSSDSHFAVLRRLVPELARRGHNVTIYTTHRLAEKFDNIQEVLITPEYHFWNKLQETTKVKAGLEEMSQLPEETLQKGLALEGANNVNYFLSHPLVQDLIKTPSEKFDFDLILVDLFYSEALLTFGYVHQKPTIALLNNNFEFYMERMLEILVPSPCSHLDFKSDHRNLTYWQQRKATNLCIARKQLYQKEVFKRQQELAVNFFPKLKDKLNDLQEDLLGNVAVYLFNRHIPLNKPSPRLFNTVDVGGLHIRPPQEMPWNIRRYLDEDRSGVIYMNLGNELLCSEVPQQKLDIIYKAFEDKRVVWTCHDASAVKNAPKNWFIQHLIPQADILAHPHIKMFITNGELLSLQEAIVRHVPLLGLPLFREQVSNLLLVQDSGIGYQLSAGNFTVDMLKWAFTEFSKNPKYGLAIRKVSGCFRDRPLGGLEATIYWIDYTLRHNGGQYLKTPGTASILPTSSTFTWLWIALVFILISWRIAEFVIHKRQKQNILTKVK